MSKLSLESPLLAPAKALLFLVLAMLFTYMAFPTQPDHKQINHSMANVMEDLIKVKEKKGVEFLMDMAKAMPYSYRYDGYKYVMRYTVLKDHEKYEGYIGDAYKKPYDCIRIRIYAYPSIEAAHGDGKWVGETNYVVARF